MASQAEIAHLGIAPCPILGLSSTAAPTSRHLHLPFKWIWWTKQQLRLYLELDGLYQRCGNQLGFLTLTFEGNVCDKKKAATCFKSFITGVLPDHFGGEWVAVWERQVRGAWHVHVVVDCLADVRTGYDRDVARIHGPVRGGASPTLLRLKRLLNEKAVAYGFGWRCELDPIELPLETFAYLASKLSRSKRQAAGKRARLVDFSRNFQRLYRNLTVAPPSCRQMAWKELVGILEGRLGCRPGGLSTVFGRHFNFRLFLILEEFRDLTGTDLLARIGEYQGHEAWTEPDEVVGPDGKTYELIDQVDEFLDSVVEDAGGGIRGFLPGETACIELPQQVRNHASVSSASGVRKFFPSTPASVQVSRIDTGQHGCFQQAPPSTTRSSCSDRQAATTSISVTSCECPLRRDDCGQDLPVKMGKHSSGAGQC